MKKLKLIFLFISIINNEKIIASLKNKQFDIEEKQFDIKTSQKKNIFSKSIHKLSKSITNNKKIIAGTSLIVFTISLISIIMKMRDPYNNYKINILMPFLDRLRDSDLAAYVFPDGKHYNLVRELIDAENHKFYMKVATFLLSPLGTLFGSIGSIGLIFSAISYLPSVKNSFLKLYKTIFLSDNSDYSKFNVEKSKEKYIYNLNNLNNLKNDQNKNKQEYKNKIEKYLNKLIKKQDEFIKEKNIDAKYIESYNNFYTTQICNLEKILKLDAIKEENKSLEKITEIIKKITNNNNQIKQKITTAPIEDAKFIGESTENYLKGNFTLLTLTSDQINSIKNIINNEEINNNIKKLEKITYTTLEDQENQNSYTQNIKAIFSSIDAANLLEICKILTPNEKELLLTKTLNKTEVQLKEKAKKDSEKIQNNLLKKINIKKEFKEDTAYQNEQQYQKLSTSKSFSDAASTVKINHYIKKPKIKNYNLLNELEQTIVTSEKSEEIINFIKKEETILDKLQNLQGINEISSFSENEDNKNKDISFSSSNNNYQINEQKNQIVAENNNEETLKQELNNLYNENVETLQTLMTLDAKLVSNILKDNKKLKAQIFPGRVKKN